MRQDEFLIFALRSSRDFGERVAHALGLPLSDHEERDFEDGEHKIRPLVNVRNRSVFVIHSLYADQRQSVNDKLCRLLFILGALRDASASRVTAVVPYLCYARKDRKTKARDPVTTRYVARLFEAVGADHVVTMDVHNLAAFQNAFHRATTDHLEAMKLFVEHFASQFAGHDIVVASPDVGGVKRAELFREALSNRTGRPMGSAFMEKQRSAGVVSGKSLVGDVQGKSIIIIDDLISSGTTLSRAAAACRAAGAASVVAAATHGMLIGDAEKVLGESALEKIVVTDTVAPLRLSQAFIQRKLVLLDTAPLFAEAIKRMHEGRSLVELLTG
jgi:ribose-phosphate pyrophosphokinase